MSSHQLPGKDIAYGMIRALSDESHADVADEMLNSLDRVELIDAIWALAATASAGWQTLAEASDMSFDEWADRVVAAT